MCVDDNLKEMVYHFFFVFSRFEFALKEAGYRRKGKYESVEADWPKFKTDYEATYAADYSAQELFKSPPRKQYLRNDNRLDWRDLSFGSKDSDLKKIISVIKTVRNNLFHGGKHGDSSWDDSVRVRFLLKNSISIIEILAELNNDVWTHYRGEY